MEKIVAVVVGAVVFSLLFVVCWVYSLTAECYGVFAQYRFRCVLGELGRFREGTGFREPVPGFDGFQEFRVSTGSDGSESGCGFEGFGVPGFDGF